MKPGRGRPVRFLAVVTTGWIGMRVVLLRPDAVEVVGQGAAVLGVPRVVAAEAVPVADRGKAIARPVSQRTTRPRTVVAETVAPSLDLALTVPVEVGAAEPVGGDTVSGPLLPLPDLPPSRARPGLSGTAWVALRGGAGTGGPVQLGGGQAGARLRLPIGHTNRVAMIGRVAAPLTGQGSEAALGIEWRPVGNAVAMVAERRVSLDGGADATGLGVIAGIDRAVSERIVIEGYGQAGIVLRSGTEPYADGAARVLYTVGRLRVGAGSWGAAQRQGARFDIGPSAVAELPVGKQTMRLSLDWRQRVAGNAAPGSGLAVTLGSDF